VEVYIKTVEELLRIFFRRTRENGGEAIPLTPVIHSIHSQGNGHDNPRMVFGRELCVPCKLLFGVAAEMEQAMTGYMTEVMEHFHEVH
jgi:hypothetical protein